MRIEYAPSYIAKVLRWAMIDANVTEGDERGTFNIEPLDGRGDVDESRLLSALILAYIDAGQPAHTIMESSRS